jgi:hypothetical protein
MKLSEVYRTAIKEAIQADVRGKKQIDAELRRQKERFDKLGKKERENFDPDLLWNPYHDSRLLHGDPELEVKEMFWGVDVTSAEIVLTDRLRERGTRVDAIMGHHPTGKARTIFPDVMHVQEQMMEDFGVPINVAEDILAPRIKEISRSVHPANFNQAVDAARLLDVPFMCLHSPCDILGQKFLQELMDKEKPERVSDVIDIMAGLPEYEQSARLNNQPDVIFGDRNRRAGRVMIKFAGGTSGPKEMYETLGKAGVGTFICMHIPENHLEDVRKAHMNIIVAGHMASDSLGINLMADRMEAKGVRVSPFSGLLRVRRR